MVVPEDEPDAPDDDRPEEDEPWEEVDVFGDREPEGPASPQPDPTGGDEVLGDGGGGSRQGEARSAPWDPPQDATAAQEAVDALDAQEDGIAHDQGVGGGEPTAEGLCHVCEGAEGQHVCVSCEQPACSDHFWVMFALCRGCATEEEIQRLQGRRDDRYWSDVLEIKWVR